MKNRNPVKRAAGSIIAILLAVTVAFTGYPGSMFVYGESYGNNDEGSASGAETFEKIINNDVPQEYDENSTLNPYTNNKKPFMIVEQSELLVYRSCDINQKATNRVTTVFNNYENGSMKLTDGLKTLDGGWKSHTDVSAADTMQTLNYQKSIAFNPKGTGRNDHVAYVGFKSDKIYVWVYDAVNGKATGLTEVGDASWLSNKGIGYHSSRRFISITAGDYDDDGKDTFVVYLPADSGNYKLVEYSYNGTSIKKEAEDDNHFYNWSKELDIGIETRMGCSLETGDFDGNAVDDLCVVSFPQGFEEGTYYTSSDTDFKKFFPYVSCIFGTGKAGDSIFKSSTSQGQVLCLNKTTKKDGDNRNYDEYDSMRSPSAAAGDVNGDNIDEIIVAGYSAKVRDTKDDAFYSKPLDYKSITAACISVSKKNITARGHFFEANGWTKGTVSDHLSGDGYRNQVAVECVAFNGQSAAETVFINGSLYECVNEATFNEVYTPEYFSKKNTYITGRIEPKSATISDAVAAVYDDNDQGREQLMLSYCLNEWGSVTGNDYYFGLGAIYGTDYDPYNQAKDYECTNISKDQWAMANCGDARNQEMSYCIAACDNDNDGLKGAYSGKEYAYADPEVAAVIQAAPYFKDIDEEGGYSGLNTTSVNIVTGTGASSGTVKSTNWGVGGVTEGSIVFQKFVELSTNIRLGYACDTSHTFEDSVETTYSTGFSATNKDQAVVSRTPVIAYKYTLYDENDKPTTDELVISVPGEPVYQPLTVSEYNAFADEYNDRIKKAAEEYNKKYPNDKYEVTYTLKKIEIGNPEKSDPTVLGLPSDTTGNPANYWSLRWPDFNGTKLSKNRIAMSYAGGSSTSEFDKTEVHTESMETVGGFSFDGQAMVGFLFGENAVSGGSIKAGAYGSYQNLSGECSSKSTIQGMSTSGTVENINLDALTESGYSEQAAKNHAFSWDFGIWKRELVDIKNEKAKVQTQYTPFLGYATTGVTKPVLPPKNVKAAEPAANGMHQIDVTWEKNDDKLVQGYNIYQKEGSNYKKLNGNLIDANAEKYTVRGLESNTEYTFVVTSYGKLEKGATANSAESTYSNAATCKTRKNECTLTIEKTEGVTVKAESDGKSVQSGDIITEGEAVFLEIEAKDWYTIKSVTMQEGEDNPVEITSVDGKYNFLIEENTKITVEAVRNLESANITYSSDDRERGDIISATADGEPFSSGADISGGQVAFEAKAKDGYVLKEWRINHKDSDSTTVYDAAGSDTFEYIPVSEEEIVTACFVSKNDKSVAIRVTATDSKGGKVTLTDSNGNVLKKESDGKYLVRKGQEITFTAVPDNHYRFSKWTSDMSFLEDDVKEYKYRVFEDIKVGADFYAPVKYAVSYSVNNSSLGTVNADIDNNTKVVAGRNVTFKAKATSDNYRLKSWSVISGDSEETVSVSEVVPTGEYYTYKTAIDKPVKIRANFIEKEKYTVSRSDTEGYDVEVTDKDGKIVRNGEKVAYGDSIKIHWAPTENYRINKLLVNGKEKENDCTITVKENISIDAACTRLYEISDPPTRSYEVVVTDEKGKIINDGETVEEGTSIKVHWDAADGYRLDKMLVNGEKKENDCTIEVRENINARASYSRYFSNPETGKAYIDIEIGTGEEEFICTGEEIRPDVTVTFGGEEFVLTEGSDYELSYADNIRPGMASVTVTGKGEFTGTATEEFQISDNPDLHYTQLNEGLSAKISGNRLYLTWGEIVVADRYEVYVAKKSGSFTKKPTATLSGLSTTIKKLNGQKISNSYTYKVKIKAYYESGGNQKRAATSKTMMVVGSSSKYTNVKTINDFPDSLTVSQGAEYTLKPTLTKQKAKKKLLPKSYCANVSYWSSDKNVATVTSKGKVRGVSEGTCRIYVIAANGVSRYVEVTVPGNN